MSDFPRELTADNIEGAISRYLTLVSQVALINASASGLDLLRELKRGTIGVGPYPDVSLFEAANRIMTDLVILYGVRWLLRSSAFAFKAYHVEYGHDNKNAFDITASAGNKKLQGEAFNVAKQFFQTKKAKMLRKLKGSKGAGSIRMLVFNDDAVRNASALAPRQGHIYIVVDLGSGDCRSLPADLRELASR